MRKLAYVLILALLPFAPVEGLDIAKLEPVQTVAVYLQNQQVVLETDTHNKGTGKDVNSALEDLRQNASGVIYLDTAQYLLVTEEALQWAEELKGNFHSSVQLSLWDGAGEIDRAARYLSVHTQRSKINRWRTFFGLKN